jgi:hypothetical protein
LKTRFPVLPKAASPASRRAEPSAPTSPSAPAAPTGRQWLAAAALIALYAALGLWRPGRPGLHYDEAFPASFAYKLLHPETPWQLPYGRRIAVGNRFLVGSTGNHYRGPLRGYLTAPWVMVMPLGTAAVRALGVLTGAAALVMVFLIMGRWFGARAGWLALALLALDPSFILQTRSDMHMNGLLLCLRLASLWALDRLWSERAWGPGAALFALTAAALWSSGEHFWFLGGVAAAAAVVARERWWRRLRENAWLLWVVLPLLAWAVLFVWADAVSPEPLARDFFERLRRVLAEQRFEEVFRRLRLIGNTLNGNAVESYYLAAPLAGRWLPFWEVLAFATALFFLRPGGPRALFLLCLPFFSLVLLVLTPPVYAPHHVMVVYPFLHMFAAAALSGLWPASGPRGPAPFRGSRAVAAVLLVFFGAGGLRQFAGFHERFAAGGAHPKWSESIDEAAEVLRESGRPAVCLDWGLGHNLAVLTRGKSPVREVRYDRREGFRTYGHEELWAGLFADRSTLFVLHAEPHSVFPGAREEFFALVREHGRRARPAAVVRRQGAPFIEFYEAY